MTDPRHYLAKLACLPRGTHTVNGIEYEAMLVGGVLVATKVQPTLTRKGAVVAIAANVSVDLVHGPVEGPEYLAQSPIEAVILSQWYNGLWKGKP